MPKYKEPEENPFIGMKLGRDVKVFDAQVGQRVTLKRGDVVPDHLVDKVTNPALFVGSPSLQQEEPDEEPWRRLTVPGLKTFAENKEIDLGSATRKKDIIAVIEQALDGSDS
jgi:hypothetical protein